MNEQIRNLSGPDNPLAGVVGRLSALPYPAKAFYMVLADPRSQTRFVYRHIALGLALVLVQSVIAGWCFAQGMLTVAYAMAAIGLLGLGAAGHGLVMLWGRSKNLRNAADERIKLEGDQGWLWKYEGALLAGLQDSQDDFVDSVSQTCEESCARRLIRDHEGLRDYWYWVSRAYDLALQRANKPPVGSRQSRSDGPQGRDEAAREPKFRERSREAGRLPRGRDH